MTWIDFPGRAAIDILLIPIGPPGMVARTIYEDSVLNHPKESPWMKRQSTNCQKQVAMNVPPWKNRHNQIAVDRRVFAVLMRSMCKWSNEISESSCWSACCRDWCSRHVRCLRDQTKTAKIEPKLMEYTRRALSIRSLSWVCDVQQVADGLSFVPKWSCYKLQKIKTC